MSYWTPDDDRPLRDAWIDPLRSFATLLVSAGLPWLVDADAFLLVGRVEGRVIEPPDPRQSPLARTTILGSVGATLPDGDDGVRSIWVYRHRLAIAHPSQRQRRNQLSDSDAAMVVLLDGRGQPYCYAPRTTSDGATAASRGEPEAFTAIDPESAMLRSGLCDAVPLRPTPATSKATTGRNDLRSPADSIVERSDSAPVGVVIPFRHRSVPQAANPERRARCASRSRQRAADGRQRLRAKQVGS